jgi:hypothetical protein
MKCPFCGTEMRKPIEHTRKHMKGQKGGQAKRIKDYYKGK